MQLINKDDFGAYVKFSANVPSRDVDFHCVDAQVIDVEPSFPDNLVSNIEAAFSESPIESNEHIEFFNDYLKPVLVCNAYRRFLLYHGRNITQFSLNVPRANEFDEVSDKGRAEMMQDALSKGKVYEMKAKRRLKELGQLDGIKYECVKRTTTRIYAI